MKARIPILLLVIILVSCNSAVDRKENVTAKVNNTTIAYNQYGNGDTTLLFVHGWCINKEYWSEQSKYFSDKYKVVALDLPGFGQSDKSRSEWTFEKYTDDINEFIKAERLKNVILIGHSMSGDILLLMDTKYPESIIGIVGIDNLKKPGVKLSEEENKSIEGFFAMMDSSFSGTVEAYTKGNLFRPSADTSIVNRVIKDFKSNDSVIAIKVLRSLIDVSQKERDMMQQLKHTLYLVNSDSDTTHIDSLKKYCKASADVVYVHGTGHYPMIEKPPEFNAALEKVIRMIGKK
ncbi:MAG TPA: alpha/beta hydrolase [Chitinophagaceae bacterium]|jgi:pimeloyl-ACP methyl ester carboxylesterase|nr:alpha/beta hydrolase [Chitinophagaceae bacterium]